MSGEPTVRDFAVGDLVLVDAFGRWRPGVVVKVNRTRVRVRYDMPSGSRVRDFPPLCLKHREFSGVGWVAIDRWCPNCGQQVEQQSAQPSEIMCRRCSIFWASDLKRMLWPRRPTKAELDAAHARAMEQLDAAPWLGGEL